MSKIFKLAALDGATPLEKEYVKICRVQSCVDLDVETLLSPKIVSRDDRIQELEKAFGDVNLQYTALNS